MYYHFAILLLFRPLVKLRIIGSKVSPREVCSQAADAIQVLLKSYSKLYTLRRTPAFVPYFVLASTIMHLVIGATKASSDLSGTMFTDVDVMGESAKVNPRVSGFLAQAIADLAEMAPYHHFAEQALNILRSVAKKWNVEAEIGGSYKPVPDDHEKLLKPYTSSLNFLPPISRRTISSTAGALRSSLLTPIYRLLCQGMGLQASVDNVDDPLIWPFPMQAPPMLPTVQELEQAGFAII